MNQKKTKKRVFTKINLLETSVVGIPSYPNAHMSFIKTLTNGCFATDEEKLNQTNQTENMTEEPQQEVAPVEEAAVETAPVEEEAKEEPVEEVKEEEAKEEEAVEEKSAPVDFEKALESALEKMAEKLETKRGLVQKEEAFNETVKKASVGELAIASGFFSA